MGLNCNDLLSQVTQDAVRMRHQRKLLQMNGGIVVSGGGSYSQTGGTACNQPGSSCTGTTVQAPQSQPASPVPQDNTAYVQDGGVKCTGVGSTCKDVTTASGTAVTPGAMPQPVKTPVNATSTNAQQTCTGDSNCGQNNGAGGTITQVSAPGAPRVMQTSQNAALAPGPQPGFSTGGFGPGLVAANTPGNAPSTQTCTGGSSCASNNGPGGSLTQINGKRRT